MWPVLVLCLPALQWTSLIRGRALAPLPLFLDSRVFCMRCLCLRTLGIVLFLAFAIAKCLGARARFLAFSRVVGTRWRNFALFQISGLRIRYRAFWICAGAPRRFLVREALVSLMARFLARARWLGSRETRRARSLFTWSVRLQEGHFAPIVLADRVNQEPQAHLNLLRARDGGGDIEGISSFWEYSPRDPPNTRGVCNPIEAVRGGDFGCHWPSGGMPLGDEYIGAPWKVPEFR